MKVKLAKTGSAVLSDIERLEFQINVKLPQSFLQFVRTHDGAEPETNIFEVGGTNESGVNGFIPVAEILKERANLDELQTTAFPIAWAEGGNYVFLDAQSGEVYFWDHEQPSKPVQIAPDFDAFLNLLEPFDPSSIQLKPGQVQSAWIDPEFLKSLGQ